MPSVKEWRNEKHSEKERREVYMQRVPLRGRVRELRHVAFWNLKRRKEEKIFFSSSSSSLLKSQNSFPLRTVGNTRKIRAPFDAAH